MGWVWRNPHRGLSVVPAYIRPWKRCEHLFRCGDVEESTRATSDTVTPAQLTGWKQGVVLGRCHCGTETLPKGVNRYAMLERTVWRLKHLVDKTLFNAGPLYPRSQRPKEGEPVARPASVAPPSQNAPRLGTRGTREASSKVEDATTRGEEGPRARTPTHWRDLSNVNCLA